LLGGPRNLTSAAEAAIRTVQEIAVLKALRHPKTQAPKNQTKKIKTIEVRAGICPADSRGRLSPHGLSFGISRSKPSRWRLASPAAERKGGREC
jgi:hypothetical protein